jgi:hypothetical protein
VDYAGNQGAVSDIGSLRTSSSYLFEAELLPILGYTPGDTALVQNMINFGENWSNQAQLLFAADDAEDSIALTFELAAADTYDVAAYFGKASNYGIASVSIDGQNVGFPMDLYSPAVTRSERLELGTLYLDAGDHRLTLQVAGKNSASTDYYIGADDFLLTSHYLLGADPVSPPVLPLSFGLRQNHPNPFNQATRLTFHLTQPGWVSLNIYDVAGRVVAKLQDGWLGAGEYALNWFANPVGSGIYFAVLRQGEQQATRKLLHIK